MDRTIKNGILRLPPFKRLLPLMLEYGWVLLVILNGNSVYHATTQIEYHLLEWSVVVTYLLLGYHLFVGNIRLMSSRTIGAVVLAVYALAYLAVRHDQISITDFTWLFVLGLPGAYLLFSSFHEKGLLMPLFRKVGDVVCVLAVMSLYFWIFGVMLKRIWPNMYTLISWGRFGWVKGYSGLHFEIQLDTTFFPDAFIYRNSGIFTEAPMLNLWLDIALAIELFLREKPSKVRIVILVVTVFTTMSVTGVVFLALCLAVHLANDRGKIHGLQKGVLICMIIVFVVPAMAWLIGYSMSLKSETQSYLMRLSDYGAGLRLWLDHPIFGSGYANLKSLQEYMYSPDNVIGFSNSLTAVLGTGGLWVAMLFYIPHVAILFTRATGSSRLACFGICYLYLFCTTAYFGRYMAVVFIAFDLAVLSVRRSGRR